MNAPAANALAFFKLRSFASSACSPVSYTHLAYPVDIHNEHNLVLIHLEPGEYYEIDVYKRQVMPSIIKNRMTAMADA